MDITTWLEGSQTVTPPAEILLRLTLAAAFGAIIGIDRELKDRPAGLRTHMLTALAAALFTLLTLELFHQVQQIGEHVSADPIRIVEAVTAGVAFLAAGAIITTRGEVRGLTTGAGMWLAGALGLACGGGYYLIAIVGAILAIIILVGLKFLQRHYMDG